LKVAFDEHVPPAFAKTFIALAKEPVIRRVSRDIVLESAADYTPKPKDADYIKGNDVPWLDRFAAAGGRAVISGDKKMREKPHEKLCLHQHGLVGIFFEAQWNEWNFFRKTALLLYWWEEVTTKIKTAARGTFWVIPNSFSPKGGELRNVSLGLAQLLKDDPNQRATSRPTRKRAIRPAQTSQIEGQDGFLDALEDKNANQKER
jgi:hypothetical protein